MFRIQGKGAEGRGRRAQLRRRMLMVDVENAVMTFQIYVDEGQVSSHCIQFFVSLTFPSQMDLATGTYTSLDCLSGGCFYLLWISYLLP